MMPDEPSTDFPTQEPIAIVEGSGNVFADVEMTDPEAELAKAELALMIHRRIKERRLTQAKAAQLLGESQPNVSMITRQKVRKVSLDRLTRHLNALGLDVVVSVRPSGSDRGHLIVNG